MRDLIPFEFTPLNLAVFGLVLSAWMILVLLFVWRQARESERVSERLDFDGPVSGRTLRLWRDGQDLTVTVQEQAVARSAGERLSQLAEDAGWRHVPVQTLALMAAAFVMFAFVIAMAATGTLLAGALSAAGAMMLMWIVVRVRITRQEALFAQQFVDALGLAARSLRAGHPLAGAFRLIAEQIRPPVGSLFAEICQQQEMGMSPEVALRRAASRSRNADFHLFTTSVAIQLRTGGNLAEMMDRLAHVIRDRMRLSRRVRVLTAQTQFSKRILIALPFILLLLLNVMNPGYVEPLYSTGIGRWLLAGGVASLLLGVWAMNRMSVLRY
ncbi:MAG: type II secretion system F family protein [Phycisphaeraceae bacterium]